MHVLVLPSWYPTRERPEQGRYFADQARAVRRAGVRIGVVYPELRSLRDASVRLVQRHHFQRSFARERGLPTLRCHGWNLGWRSPLGAWWRIHQAQTLAERYAQVQSRPDLIHAHSGRWAAAAAAQLAHRWDVPYVVTEHFSGFQRRTAFGWETRLARCALQHADGVAAVSTSLKAHLTTHGFATGVRVLPNTVDAQFFTPPPQSYRDNAPGGGPRPLRLLALGRLVRHKGHHVLLKALAHCANEREHIRLAIGGAGPERAALERLAAHLGIGQRVLFRGHLSRAAVRRALWRADALVLPSFHETFGVTLIEAMATGLPVVATRCGGPEDIVTPDTGCLVAPDDPNALADALREVRQRRAFFQSSTIRMYTKQRFGTEAVGRRLLHFYQDALAHA